MKSGHSANCSSMAGHVSTFLLRHMDEEDGQDLIEYALLAAVISVAFVASIQSVADGIIPFFDMVLAAFRSL